jgi:predicted alpha/beta-hydrolase family hydrolase
MDAARWTVAMDGADVSVALDTAQDPGATTVFVMAHGAGGNLSDRGVLALSTLYRARGVHVVRFNFPYRQRESRRPDPMPVLQRCIADVVASARLRVEAAQWLIGGRSMGGRAASMLAADGHACDGLLLLAYPLHPAGQPSRLRDAHLSSITVPVLCINGTRDALCRRDLMDAVVRRLRNDWTMHWLDGADHSFHVLQASGRTDVDVLNETGDATQAWLRRITRPQAAHHRSLR